MVTKNLHKKATTDWSKYRKSVKVLSKSGAGKVLVKSDVEMYDFDEITQDLYPNRRDCLPASADAIITRTNVFEFVEFKSGFARKITRDNFDSSKLGCPQGHGTCEAYGEKLLEKSDLEIAELIASIQTKAVDSYITLEKHIIPICENLPKKKEENNTTKIHLTIVIDEDEVKANLRRQAKLAKQTYKSKDCLSVENALKKYNKNTDASGTDYFYDEIKVVSSVDLLIFRKNQNCH